MKSTYQYRERDYAFGNLCLSLRTRISVAQGELAWLLKASERTIQAREVRSGKRISSIAEHVSMINTVACYPKGDYWSAAVAMERCAGGMYAENQAPKKVQSRRLGH